MALTLISNTILKPHAEQGESINNTSPRVPLDIFDRATIDVHIAVLHAFNPPLPSNEVLKNALANALTHYPRLTGRFAKNEQGEKCVLLNNAGIRLIEAYVPSSLADFLPFDPSSDVSHLHPPLDGTDELFQVQLNRYACGGLVLGYTSHHRVADAQSMSSFLVLWSRIVRGLEIHPISVHDRFDALAPRSHPKVEFDHRAIEFEHSTVPDSPVLSFSFDKLVTSFSIEFINKIKAKVSESEEDFSSNKRYSSFECLLTHVWKKVTEARALEVEKISELSIPVNCRPRTIPPVPLEYFGNMVLKAYTKLSVGEILTESYAYVAKAIHEAVIKIDNEYIQSFTDFGELCRRNGEELDAPLPVAGPTLCPHLAADSWLRFNFHDLDFGSGPSVFCYPVIPVEGVAVFLPSMKGPGDGIDVIISLMPNHAEVFKKISHSLE